MKVFLIGGTGVLGIAAAKELVKAGHQVTSTLRSPHKKEQLANIGVAAKPVDVYSVSDLRAAIRGFDVVARLTTSIPPLMQMRRLDAWAETNRLRTDGASALVDACLAENIPTYISESITLIYADGGKRWLKEDDPVDAAGLSTLQAVLTGESEAARIMQNGGRGLVLRFGLFYGPQASTTLALASMVRSRKLPSIGKGEHFVSSVWIDDAGAAVAAALNAPSGIYNVVDDNPVTSREQLETIARAFKAPPPLHLPAVLGRTLYGPMWKYVSRSQRASNAAFKQATGWAPIIGSVHVGWDEIARLNSSGRP